MAAASSSSSSSSSTAAAAAAAAASSDHAGPYVVRVLYNKQPLQLPGASPRWVNRSGSLLRVCAGGDNCCIRVWHAGDVLQCVICLYSHETLTSAGIEGHNGKLWGPLGCLGGMVSDAIHLTADARHSPYFPM